jgi:hypothetical protein
MALQSGDNTGPRITSRQFNGEVWKEVTLVGTTPKTLTHNLGRRALSVQCFDTTTGAQGAITNPVVTQPDVNSIVLTPTGNGTYSVCIRWKPTPSIQAQIIPEFA